MVRGGISLNCKGYAQANNKFVKSYDTNKLTSYIKYLDANNLCGHSMMQLLPTEIFDSFDSKDLSLDNYSKDSSIGCFLEADLDYPDELHDLHNDYPLEGEKIKVTEEMLPEYQLQIIKE